MNKKVARLKRARRSRNKIKRLEMPRLSVHRTLQHVYAQVIDISGRVLACASTVEKDIREKIKELKQSELAVIVGQQIAKRAKDSKISRVAFDRGGFKYHGVIKALADAAREAGLEF